MFCKGSIYLTVIEGLQNSLNVTQNCPVTTGCGFDLDKYLIPDSFGVRKERLYCKKNTC